MKKVYKHIFILFFLIQFSKVWGQDIYNLPPYKHYKKATLGLMNYEKKNANNLTLMKDSVQFSNNGKSYSIPFNEINYIRVNEGNNSGNGALIGGGSMLLISLSAIAQINNDPNQKTNNKVGPLIVLFTLGGSLVGALIGSASKREKSYYIHASGN